MKYIKKKKVVAVGLILLVALGLIAGCADRRSVSEQVEDYLNKELNAKGPDWEDTQEQLKENFEDEIEDDIPMVEEQPEQIEEEKEPVEIELDWGDLEVDESIVISEENVETLEDELTEIKENKLQLVFLGDSIFDMARDGTGVPYLTAEACNDANLYNLAIGGTSAALKVHDPTNYEDWDSTSVLGMAKAIEGVIDAEKVFSGYHALDVFQSCDFSKTDYFIVECGTNDFLSQIPISLKQGGTYAWFTYYGALEEIINALSGAAPDAQIIFCTPHYERFYGKEHVWLGDVNSYDLGYGPLIDYISAGYNAADVCGAYVINCYDELNINGYTAADYLLDGIHLNEEGRKMYAEMLSRRIMNMEMEKGN